MPRSPGPRYTNGVSTWIQVGHRLAPGMGTPIPYESSVNGSGTAHYREVRPLLRGSIGDAADGSVGVIVQPLCPTVDHESLEV